MPIFFYRQVENTLQQIENNEFIKFYTPEQAAKFDLQNPDQILEVNFEDFIVGETHTKEVVEKMERDSVVVGEITLDSGRKKEVIGSVNAEVALFRMEVVSRGLVNLSITKNGLDDKDLIYQDFPRRICLVSRMGTIQRGPKSINARTDRGL